ncbi:carboxypeptidase regulatory-like domain-containing protein [Roseisolibacter sp. H3M3-2]|uniref:carboxypeptidase regulatory-like domain-containing protein n=1 Tax=Roseisolibacter sp. H3M3-2 TaxID=3031323 RepID=UPI0023DA30CE|nr:carboxypeptidase regulatory-like domain-containing protein [Roseisolibacter sp. H3M3-2]MDF1505773.1 carboxypeptidase regulatory-like domain-containing protein [Roseisolibacter sp. H3M3-2]
MPRSAPLLRLAALAIGMTSLAPAAADAQAKPRPGQLPGSRPATPPTGQPGRPATAPRQLPPPLPVDSAKPLAVYGVVTDSIAGGPLAGATVQLAHEQDRAISFTAETDSSGRWRIPGVRPGRYLAGFFHPTLDALGIEPPVSLVQILPDTAARLDLGTPGPMAVRAKVCPQAPGDRAVLLGSVGNADTGEPIAESKIVLTWSEMRISEEGVRNVKRRLPVRVRADGGYVACDLPADVDLVANAEAPRRRGGLIELRLPPRSLTRRDFALGDSVSVVTVQLPDTAAQREGRLQQPITVARGNARLSGTVRTRDGRPLQGARVALWGSDVQGTTTEAGSFALAGLPAGTYALEVRAIGFAPKRVPVTLSARAPGSVGVVLDERLNTLQSVVVQADRTKLNKDYNGFMERKRRGMGGRFITEDDLNRRNPIVITDALRTTPGLSVVPNGTGFGYAIQGRGGCTPDVWVDGMRVFDGATDLDQLVRPMDVAGVEVYNSAGTIPAQFMGAAGGGNCGVVAIWTKRGR